MQPLKEIEAAVIGDFVPVESIEVGERGRGSSALCVQAVEKEYKQQLAAGSLSEDLKFSYSWHLIKSGYKNDIRKGISMMESEGTQKDALTCV